MHTIIGTELSTEYFSGMSFVNLPFFEKCYDTSLLTQKRAFHTMDAFLQLAAIQSRNVQNSFGAQRQKHPNHHCKFASLEVTTSEIVYVEDRLI